MKCPVCEQTRIVLQGTQKAYIVLVNDLLTEVYAAGPPVWNDLSPAECSSCDWVGVGKDLV